MYSSRSLLRAMSTAKAKNICVKHDKHNNVFYVEIPGLLTYFPTLLLEVWLVVVNFC